MKLESDIMGQTERLRCLLEYEDPKESRVLNGYARIW